MRSHAKASVVVAALFAFLAFASSASADYSPTGTFSGEGSGDGQLMTPGRAAVEQSTGNLFVVDSGNNRVQVFAPNGSGTADYLTQFGGGELSAPWGIAIDEDAGQTYLYVADAGNEEIVKYDSDEGAIPSFTVDPDFTSPSKGAGAGEVGDFHAALAIDPTTHELLVADNANKRIARFEADGTPDGSFDGSAGTGSPGAFAGPIDVAVNSTGDVYVIDANGNIAEQGGTSQALRYSGGGGYKATLGPVGARQRPAVLTVNRFDDSVLVSGDQDGVFENETPKFYGFDSANSPTFTVQANSAAQYDSVSGLAVASSSSDVLYAVLDYGYYFGSPLGSPQIQAFEQFHPTAPTVVSQSASPAYTEATLEASINPGGLETSYRFEYGSTASYGHTTPTKTVPADGQPVAVSDFLFDLAPGSTYHFRVVATNALETAEGVDLTFTTSSKPSPSETCANAAIRQQQHSTFLPDCRAYEQVTPVKKVGYPVGANLRTNVYMGVGPSDQISYLGSYPIPPANTGSVGGYFGGRSGGVWASAGIAGPPGPNQIGAGIPGKSAIVRGTSADQSAAVYWDSTTEPWSSLWVARTDGTRIRIADAVTLADNEGLGPGIPRFIGMSADGSHVLFVDSNLLLPVEGPQPTGDVLYEWVAGPTAGAPGSLRIVNVNEAGELLSPSSAELGGVADGARIVDERRHAPLQNAVSADGSRIYFQNPAPAAPESGGGPLYLREDGAKTIEVSAPESGLPAASGVLFLGASLNGAVTYFYADAPLTDDADPAGGIYRYERQGEGGQLSWVAGTGGSIPSGIVSGDGTHLYYQSGSEVRLATAAGGSELVKADAIIGVGQGSGEEFALGTGVGSDYCPSANVTHTGRYFAFVARGQSVGTGEAQVYRFDAAADALTRISDGPVAPSQPYDAAFTAFCDSDKVNQDTRVMSADGQRIFFDTATALVPEDTNHFFDTYRWEDGQVSLITTGTGPSDSGFVGTDSSGDNAYIVTQEPLVAQDGDAVFDIYDARSGGGLPAQNEPPGEVQVCAGEACQGAPGAAPGGMTPGSLTVHGKSSLGGKQTIHAYGRFTFSGPSGFLGVQVPARGRLTVSGQRVKRATRSVPKAGRYKIHVSLTPASRRLLTTRNELETEVQIKFEPVKGSGPPVRDRQRLSFKSASKKKGR